MFILDTNVVSALLWKAGRNDLNARVEAVPAADIWLTVITVSEMMQGRITRIHREPKAERLPLLYSYFQQTYQALQFYQVLPFDEAELAAFQTIPAKVRQRAGTQDCRIAAIALAHEFRVVTCNVSDFHLVPGLRVEDWSQTIA